MITNAILIGGGLGAGVLLIALGLAPRRTPLADALRPLLDPPSQDGAQPTSAAGWRTHVSGVVAAIQQATGTDANGLTADLRVIGRPSEQHLIHKATGALIGLSAPLGAALLWRSAGGDVALGAVTVVGFALAVAGFVLPDILLRRHAAQRRRDLRYALSSYLDLTHILLAAGAGTETALAQASEAGQGWGFAELRRALHHSRLAGDTPWAAFHRLGEELDVPELRDIATSLALAGTHGAKVRDSLRARANALRARDLAEMEGEADAATERMALPSVLMVVAFVMFVGYPAIAEILGS